MGITLLFHPYLCFLLSYFVCLLLALPRYIFLLLSSRHVVVWGLAEDRLREQHDIAAHELEAWITTFDCADPNMVWSGADDCLLRGWDLRTNCASPLFSKRHGIHHTDPPLSLSPFLPLPPPLPLLLLLLLLLLDELLEMGVTSIQFNTEEQYTVAVGCYDERIHTFLPPLVPSCPLLSSLVFSLMTNRCITVGYTLDDEAIREGEGGGRRGMEGEVDHPQLPPTPRHCLHARWLPSILLPLPPPPPYPFKVTRSDVMRYGSTRKGD